MLPVAFPPLPLALVQQEGWGSLWSRVRCVQALFCLLSSFVDWGYWSCSRVANSCYFLCPIGSPSSSLYDCRGDGVGEWFGVLGLFSVVSPGEEVRRVRFSSAAPVSFPPWPLNLRPERQGGSLSPLLVEWLSFAVLLLALPLRLPCSIKRSRCCERGLSRWLFSFVRSLCERWRFTDC